MLSYSLTDTLKNILHIENDLIILFIYSVVIGFIIQIISKLLINVNRKLNFTEKQIYTNNKRNRTIFSILYILILIFIWQEQLKSVLTLITFISAAITLAIKDIIFNYFGGIYIKLAKPIKVEDRVQIYDIIGDVVNLNTLNFEVLEVNPENNQSTGIIIHMPNLLIFNYPLKNYTSVFKYIWDEITINVALDSDIEKAKKIIIDILNKSEDLSDVPKKTKRELNRSSADYRIYYNNLTPIVYTRLEEEKICLVARFLVHPKKQRNIESAIYEQIITEFRKQKIVLK